MAGRQSHGLYSAASAAVRRVCGGSIVVRPLVEGWDLGRRAMRVVLLLLRCIALQAQTACDLRVQCEAGGAADSTCWEVAVQQMWSLLPQ